ncbi:MAG: hypothetical protein BWY24_00039 [Microgenomates group bacterium ADurb.Bin219]|nr:MAG: hypothetical protein BWY24_00039 [Microgenomates group bacterium ADurb.Bin219]HNP89114.1 hypothetical protein [Candidatus Woesebacteria bacterium]
MRKIILTLSLFLLLLVTLVTPLARAQNEVERPRGLEDKGPLTKITFIHYKNGTVRQYPATKPKVSACYTFLASGAKWKTTEEYLINPINQDGLSGDFIKDAFDKGTTAWESQVSFNIFGSSILDSASVYQTESPDGENVVVFDDYPDNGVIAITSVWGYFSGPPKTRELIEWDMLLNERFVWGNADGNESVMDLQNIATHELGHSAGMGDLYTTDCNLETMFGYSSEGEIIKRDLNSGDIVGIKKLYP